MITEKEQVPDLPTISPADFEPLRATIIDSTPSHFVIDLKNLANISVDENAPIFALYVGKVLPNTCGDFRDLDLHFAKTGKFERALNLQNHDKVLRAVSNYECIVLRNTSS